MQARRALADIGYDMVLYEGGTHAPTYRLFTLLSYADYLHCSEFLSR
jgi:hypothetical protein